MFSSGLLHERFPWYPLWAPSYESLLSLPEAVLDNAKAVLLDPTKDKKDIAIEVTIVFVQYVALLFAFLGVPPLPPPPWFLAQFAGVALACVGIFFFLTSPATLAGRLTVLPTVGPEAVLVTEGVFSHCRHPQYFGLIAFALGVSTLSLSLNRLFWTVLMWLVLEKKADIEEACLLGKFPGRYSHYMTTTPKLIPGVLIGGAKGDASPTAARREGFVVLSNEAEIAE